jgi:hypothetical protein
MRSRFWGVSTAALCAVGFLACGSDGGAPIEESPNLGASTEKLITAADGGDVMLPEAGVKLSIPAGALGADTMISAEVISKKELVDAAQLAGNVLEFGPNGTTFEQPVTLELDASEANIPEGAKVALAWFDTQSKKWVDLPGSKLSGGKVVGQTTHFTVFAIRFEVASNGEVVQVGGQCSGAFSACGGDPEGTWNIVSGCANVDQSLGNAGTQCQGASVSLGMDITGDIVIRGGHISGTLNMESSITAVLPKSCVGGSCSGAGDGDIVFVDKGSTCEGTSTDSQSNPIDESYRVEGGRIYVGDSSSDEQSEFCVTGNKLVVRMNTGEGVEIRWTAMRK